MHEGRDPSYVPARFRDDYLDDPYRLPRHVRMRILFAAVILTWSPIVGAVVYAWRS